MLSATSHEFRNPLAGIISMLSIIETNLDESHKYYLNIARASADLLLFLANDMLDYAQIEAGKLKLQFANFNIKSTCSDLVDLLKFKAQSKNIDLKLNLTLNGKEEINSDQNRFK